MTNRFPLHFLGEISMKNQVISAIRQFLVSEDGPTAVEYAVLTAILVVGLITVIKNMSASMSSSFSSVSSALTTAS